MALSTARAIFSPTTEPMLPPMKLKSMTTSWTGRPPILASPEMTASLRPVFLAAALQLFLVVLEAQGVLRGEAVLHLQERVLVDQKGKPLRCRDAEMVVAFRADLEVFLDLFAVDDLLAVVALDPQAFGIFTFFAGVRTSAFRVVLS